MKADDFDYELPPERIAQEPLAERDASRLLVVDRTTGRLEHGHFRDLPAMLGPGDLLVRNDAAVLPARLRGRKASGGAVECLLHRPSGHPDRWWCLLRPARRLAPGATFGQEGRFTATVEASAEDGREHLVAFACPEGDGAAAIARRHGEVPLPPYIERSAADPRSAADRERYQTVYARPDRAFAVAAPTAGLHFTPAVLAAAAARGATWADVTLHVGAGTFRPLGEGDLTAHVMHEEVFEVPASTAARLRDPAVRRRIAIGTTVVRTLEDYALRPEAAAGAGLVAASRLFIRPPWAWRQVGALVTNFHQPRSTLLCLVAAFLEPDGSGGVRWWREIYREALAHGYRFLSYGDAMFIR